MERVANRVDQLAETCQDLDRRLLRMDAKFEVIERVVTTRRSLRGKSKS